MRDFINERKPTLLDADRHWEQYKESINQGESKKNKKIRKKSSKKVIKVNASA